MANEQLRKAIADAGLEPEDLADRVQVDVKTVQRWINGRAPYTRHRAQVARILGVEVSTLWPQAGPPAQTDAQTAAVPSQDPPTANDVHPISLMQLLTDATEQIDLLDYTLLEVLETPGFIQGLKEKAAAGCRVRILVVKAGAVQHDEIDREIATLNGRANNDEPPKPAMARQAYAAKEMLESLFGVPGIEVRSYSGHRYNSMLRFDGQMIAVIHLYGTRPENAPRSLCTDDDRDGLFGYFAAQFDAIWENASEPLDPAIRTATTYDNQVEAPEEEVEDETMQPLIDDLIPYPGIDNITGLCHLRIYERPNNTPVAIVGQLDDNPGTAINNAIETIAALIRNQELDGHEFLLITYHTFGGAPYRRVEFAAGLTDPIWYPVPDITAILGTTPDQWEHGTYTAEHLFGHRGTALRDQVADQAHAAATDIAERLK